MLLKITNYFVKNLSTISNTFYFCKKSLCVSYLLPKGQLIEEGNHILIKERKPGLLGMIRYNPVITPKIASRNPLKLHLNFFCQNWPSSCTVQNKYSKSTQWHNIMCNFWQYDYILALWEYVVDKLGRTPTWTLLCVWSSQQVAHQLPCQPVLPKPQHSVC